MKKILLIAIVFASIACYSQNKFNIKFTGIGLENYYFITPNYTYVNFKYQYPGAIMDSGFHVPRYAGGPTIRGGIWSGAGNIGVDTVGHVFYFYSGGIWRAVGAGQWTTTGSDIYYNTGGVGVGATSVNSRSILELTSTTKGFLMPRMNTTQQTAISSPPSGLIIYNTDSLAFMYYNGTSWIKVGTGTGGGAADGRGNDSLTFKDEGVALGTKGSVKIFNTVGQSVKTIRVGDSLTVFGSSNNNSYQKTGTVMDQKYYDAFTSMAWDKNTFHTCAMAYKSSGSHAADGPAMITYSHDGFASFTPPDTIKLNGTNLTNANTVSLGRGNKTRWVAMWNAGAATTNGINFAYNDEEDETFSAIDSLVLAMYQWAAVYGQIMQVNQDTLYAFGYGVDTITGHTQTSIFYIKSYNNGVSWSYGGLINYGGSINANALPGEYDPVIISGTQVSDTKILGVARDDFYKGYHNEITSADGGATWVSHITTGEADWAFGATNAGFTVDNSWPVGLIVREGIIYALHSIRNTQAGGGYQLRIFKGNAQDVFSNVHNWDLRYTTHYRAGSWYVSAGDKDFGYYHPFPTPTGEIKASYYDEAAIGGFGFPYTNVKVMSIANNYYEAFNDANQSITSGTETTVTFPDPFLDGQRYFNTDSSKIYAASDGYYTISAQFLIDTSSLGTYRQAKIKVILTGNEYVGGGAVTERVISKTTIQPSTDFNFCWVELHAQAFIRSGEEIRVTFKHDKGSSLNLLNTISDINIDGGGARIKIKKID